MLLHIKLLGSVWKLPHRHYQHEMFRFVPRYFFSLTAWVPLKDNKDVYDKLRKLLKEAIKTSFNSKHDPEKKSYCISRTSH